jgi:hypothetical protein
MATLTEKDYCDYDTSITLGELGFPLKRMKVKNFIDGEFSESIVTVLLYEAQKWLREEKEIAVFVTYDKNTSKWFATVINMDSLETINMARCDLYEDALSEGIKEAVKILKKK